jgi:hypothetical protein
MLHRVTEVTKGKRNSLVVWVSGYPFKWFQYFGRKLSILV